MTGKLQAEQTATLPSGYVGVYRAGKRWEAYVAEEDDLVLLGTYATKRAAVAARVKYWKAREGKPARRMSAGRASRELGGVNHP